MATNNPIQSKTQIVKCEGMGLDSGHPAVYLNFGNKNSITCPYCSQMFEKTETGNK